MPEMKHNFLKGRMNKDLDERLVSDGEYREAMNIEVATSESDAVGTVQSTRGNIMAYNTVLDTPSNRLAPQGGEIVGSYAHGREDTIYLFVTCKEYTHAASGHIVKDMIVEYKDGNVFPVIVDVHMVTYRASEIDSIDTDTRKIFMDTIATDGVANVDSTPGNTVTFYNSNGIMLLETELYSTNTASNSLTFVDDVSLYMPWVVDPAMRVSTIVYNRKKILNFKPSNIITGINIIDDLLFWTDNVSEPKKINIQRSKEGTSGFHQRSKFRVRAEDGSVQSEKPMQEEHITMVKRSPLKPPILEMYNNIDGRGEIAGRTDLVNLTTRVDIGNGVFEVRQPNVDSVLEIPMSGNMPEYEVGDILLFSNDEININVGGAFDSDWQVRGYLMEIIGSSLRIKVLGVDPDFFDFVEDLTNNTVGEVFAVSLEQAKALFEFKFPRFAYRYKYQDGEYSCFSGFSEIAFLPGNFKWNSSSGYNIGMVNQLRFLKIMDFVPDGIPKGVTSIDILYKESNSPNIYTVKTIKSTDSEWNAVGSGGPTAMTKGRLELESEVIYATVPSNQLLRPWDNVPRFALGQEIVGNRVIYGNYVQNYNIPKDVSSNINIKTYIKSRSIDSILAEIDVLGQPGKSIKSLRTYQLGVVYKDIYGRETPVLTNEKASFNIGKQQAAEYNSLSIQVRNPAPEWAETFKVFVKETSNEYYNLAMDRWYEAEDGNIWMSFASADRNKVQEDSYLILKKEHDSDEPVLEEGRYKVLAIDNNVPDYVKTERHSYGDGDCENDTFSPDDGDFTVQKWEETQFENQLEKEAGLRVRLMDASAANKTDWYKIKSIKVKGGSNKIATISIRGSFGEGIESIAPEPTTAYDLKFEISQFKEVMKPEFDGRFFVKVVKETALINKITLKNASLTGKQFVVSNFARQYFIRNMDPNTRWSRESQWYDSSQGWKKKMRKHTGRNEAFFIDDLRRGSATGYGVDNGYGINGSRPSNKAPELSCHLELGLTGIEDGGKRGFSIGRHQQDQQNFYYKIIKVGTFFRWKEDPNGNIYRVTKTKSHGDRMYGDVHGSGIYNHCGSAKCKYYRSNKTRRIYMHMEHTGYYYREKSDDTLTYFDQYGEVDEDVRGSVPRWIDENSSIPGAFSPIYSGRSWLEQQEGENLTTGTKWKNNLLDITADMQNATTPLELATACQAQALLQDDTNQAAGTKCLANASQGNPIGNFYLSQADGLTGLIVGVTNPSNEIGVQQPLVDATWNLAATGKKQEVKDINGNVNTAWNVHTNKYVTIEILEAFESETDMFASDNPAIFETEPKEDVDLDIYHEIDQAFPVKLTGATNELFIPYGSIVSSDNPDIVLRNVQPIDMPPCSPCWDEGEFTGNEDIVTLTSAANLSGEYIVPGQVVTTNDKNTIPQWNHIDPNLRYDTTVIAVDGTGLLLSNVSNVLANTTVTRVINYYNVSPATVNQWSDNRIALNCDPTNPMATRLPTTGALTDLATPNAALLKNILKFTKPNGTTVTASIKPSFLGGFNDTHNINSTGVNQGAGVATNFPNWSTPATFFMLDINTSDTMIDLDWHNCYSFANGVESDRIRDDFNAVRIDKGPKASTTLAEKYEEERRQNGLIYSGIYNSTSGTNNLNQFIQAEKITKDLNPRFGSIQKLHARDTDLVTLCEDKVLRLLANKDAVFNADGNPQLVSTDRVLGQAVPYSGDYGISKNPESFASQSFRSYFTDKQRGVVLRLSKDGLVPISDHGMKDWFADNLKAASGNLPIIGSYDVKKDSYNLTLRNTYDGNITVTFNERTNGWPSFKSFIQYGGVSLNNTYFTFNDGEMYRHHIDTSIQNTATFYNQRTNPYVDVLLNEAPGSIKSFGTLNYEGSKASITENLTDGEYYNNVAESGWFLRSGETDSQSIDTLEFKDKEGKYFARIKGQNTTLNNLNEKEFSTQGIDIASNVVIFQSSYDCLDGQCLDPGTGLGQYSTLADCEANCRQTEPPKWICKTMPGNTTPTCEQLNSTDSGYNLAPYSSLADCQNSGCGSVATQSWDCSAGGCIDPGNGQGQYSTLAACQAACPQTPPPLWMCGTISAACTPNCCVEVLPTDNTYSSLVIGSNAWLTQSQCNNACQVHGCTDDGNDPNFPGRPPGWIGPASNYYAGATIDDGSCQYLQSITFKDDPSDH
tara:strand:- start:3607 stop:10086 length:6480 start_codon:yes stop_codon:yes gene_type:complete